MEVAPLPINIITIICFLFLSTSGMALLLPPRSLATAQHFSSGLQVGLISSECLVLLFIDRVTGLSKDVWHIVFVCGLATGSIAVLWLDFSRELLFGLLGGFSFAVWLLLLHEDGLAGSIPIRVMLIAGLMIAVALLSCLERTQAVASACARRFAGVTSLLLGIDCLAQTGLKEFCIFILDVNKDIYHSAEPFKMTRGAYAIIILIPSLTIALSLGDWIFTIAKVYRRRGKNPFAYDEEMTRQERREDGKHPSAGEICRSDSLDGHGLATVSSSYETTSERADLVLEQDVRVMATGSNGELSVAPCSNSLRRQSVLDAMLETHGYDHILRHDSLLRKSFGSRIDAVLTLWRTDNLTTQIARNRHSSIGMKPVSYIGGRHVSRTSTSASSIYHRLSRPTFLSSSCFLTLEDLESSKAYQKSRLMHDSAEWETRFTHLEDVYQDMNRERPQDLPADLEQQSNTYGICVGGRVSTLLAPLPVAALNPWRRQSKNRRRLRRTKRISIDSNISNRSMRFPGRSVLYKAYEREESAKTDDSWF